MDNAGAIDCPFCSEVCVCEATSTASLSGDYDTADAATVREIEAAAVEDAQTEEHPAAEAPPAEGGEAPPAEPPEAPPGEGPEALVEPLAEQPLAEQPLAEQPLAEQPPAEQPLVEQPPCYSVTFDAGPLHLNLEARGEYGRPYVTGFVRAEGGSMGQAEASGVVRVRDILCGLDGTDLTGVSFHTVVRALKNQTPTTLTFRRHDAPPLPRVRRQWWCCSSGSVTP